MKKSRQSSAILAVILVKKKNLRGLSLVAVLKKKTA